jgi:apolipoprotein N-acyltransferase
MACAFPPIDLWPLAFLAPVPLMWAGLRLRGRWMPLLVGLGLLPLWLYEQQWVIDISALGYAPMAVTLALFYVLFVWATARAARRLRNPWALALALPVLWTGAEVFRGEVTFTGYPWFLIAHPLIAIPALAAPASVLGTYFVSFLVAAAAAAGALLILDARRRWGGALVLGAIAAAGWLGSPLILRRGPAGAPVTVAVVQTNLPQSNKIQWPVEDRIASFNRFAALTDRAARARPDLIVWPETMFPGDVLDPWVQDKLRQLADAGKLEPESVSLLPMYGELLALQRRAGSPMLVGALGMDRDAGEGERAAQHNSVFLITGGRVADIRYDKLHLTPFGEVMPYIRYWPWLQKQMLALAAGGMSFDLAPGVAPNVFHLPSQPGTVIATPICFEGTSASVCRRLTRAAGPRPMVIINLTNDGWFGNFDPGRWQHLQAARWRAVEFGVPLVRAANTGVSAAIDARGRLLAAGTDDGALARRDGVLSARVAPTRSSTIFARVGYVFTWLALGLAGLLVLATFIRRPIEQRSVP